MKTLMELEDNDCRFPFGDSAPFLFCGDPAQDKSSYCTHHHTECWHPVQPKPAKARVYHGTDLARRVSA
jgi:hypothetical protein